MLGIGLLSYELERPTPEELFKSLREFGYTAAQFSFFPFVKEEGHWGNEIPLNVDEELARRVAKAAKAYDIDIAMADGFVNLSAADLTERSNALYRLEKIARACRIIGCDKICISTGSRGANLWAWHPDNSMVTAYTELCDTMEKALIFAEHYKVQLCIEMEPNNVINGPARARRIMDDMGSDYLKVVLDGANLFQPGECYKVNAQETLRRAFDIVGDDIVAVHAKDIQEGPVFTYAGNGIVDFDFMLDGLQAIGYQGAIISHGTHGEDEIKKSAQFLRKKLEEHCM